MIWDFVFEASGFITGCLFMWTIMAKRVLPNRVKQGVAATLQAKKESDARLLEIQARDTQRISVARPGTGTSRVSQASLDGAPHVRRSGISEL